MERLYPAPAWLRTVMNTFGLSYSTYRAGLAKKFARRNKLSMDARARRLFKQLDRGYNRLEKAGIYHNDIHPGNVMVNRHGEFMLIDAM